MKVVKGNILKAEVDIICHQCNCSSRNSVGLARDMFDKFPNANTYKNRTKTEDYLFGNCSWHKTDLFWICNMYAQLYPGKPDNYMDSAERRLSAFQSCLNHLALFCRSNDLHSIAFPFKIGCGYAKGNWNSYKDILQKFYQENPFKIYIINPFLGDCLYE